MLLVFIIFSGWKICLKGDAIASFSYIIMAAKLGDYIKLETHVRDSSEYTTHLVGTTYDAENQDFGVAQRLTGTTNLNLNITFLAYTQVKIDIGAPFQYSATSTLMNTNTLAEIDTVRLYSDGLTVMELNLDC